MQRKYLGGPAEPLRSQFDSNTRLRGSGDKIPEAQASEVSNSTVPAYLGECPAVQLIGFLWDFEISKNGDRLGTRIARLTVRLGEETSGLHWYYD